jgi:hypothetical protein
MPKLGFGLRLGFQVVEIGGSLCLAGIGGGGDPAVGDGLVGWQVG